MEKKRLFYDTVVLSKIKHAEQLASEMSLSINREFIDYHNYICPSCLKNMKLDYSNTVKNVGAFSMGIYTDELKMVIPYVLCKPCFKKMNNKTDSSKLEEYIFETLKL